MCVGVPYFANNKRAVYGKKSNSHSTSAPQLKIDEDKFMKFEYHWWDKVVKQDYYDQLGKEIIKTIDPVKAEKLVNESVRKHFKTQDQLATWLRGVPEEWGRLMEPKYASLARKVNPKLVIYQSKISKFKKENIEKYNPYQQTKLPTLETIKKGIPKSLRNQVGDKVWDQVRKQVWNQVRKQVWDQVWNQVRKQVWDQVRDQVRNQVGNQVGNQVRDQVWDQVRDQVYSTSYWGIKVILGLPIKHWFFDFLKLGIMIVFVQGKVKVFGKKGKYLGEYDRKDFDK